MEILCEECDTRGCRGYKKHLKKPGQSAEAAGVYNNPETQRRPGVTTQKVRCFIPSQTFNFRFLEAPEVRCERRGKSLRKSNPLQPSLPAPGTRLQGGLASPHRDPLKLCFCCCLLKTRVILGQHFSISESEQQRNLASQ